MTYVPPQTARIGNLVLAWGTSTVNPPSTVEIYDFGGNKAVFDYRDSLRISKELKRVYKEMNKGA